MSLLNCMRAPKRYRRATQWSMAFVLLVQVAILLAPGCTNSSDPPQDRRGRCYVILVDFSGSTRRLLDQYHHALMEVMGAVRLGDRFIVAPINAHTLTGYKEPIAQGDLQILKCSGGEKLWSLQGFSCLNENPRQLKLDNEKIQARNEGLVQAAKEEINEAFRRQLQGESSQNRSEMEEEKHTSILSGFMLAQRLFDDDPRRRVLIVLSDMIEDSDQYNFNDEKLTQRDDLRIIEQLERGEELPNLRDVFVCVEPPAQSEDLARFLKIQNFWLLYFRRTGADADESRYVSSLVNCIGQNSEWAPSTPTPNSTRRACNVRFGIGSDARSVLIVEGYPTSRKIEGDAQIWHYGSASYIEFMNNRVTRFFNAGNLKACR